jgi:hypothetical protein
MTPDAITLLFKEARDTFPPIEGKPTDDDLQSIRKKLIPILMEIPYDQLGGTHSLVGILTDAARYAANHGGATFVCPLCLPLYDVTIADNATTVVYIPAESAIIHGLQVMSGALINAPPPTSMSQVEAIANLRDLFESWRLLGLPSSGQGRILSPRRPRVSIQEPPKVASPSSSTVVPPPWTEWTPPPCLVSSTQVPLPVHSPIQVMPHHITFDDTPPPRVATPLSPPRAFIEPRPPHALPHMSPITHRTRACTKAPLALFTSGRPCCNDISYHIPMAKTLRVPEEPLGFADLCQDFSMTPKEADGFAYLCAAL